MAIDTEIETGDKQTYVELHGEIRKVALRVGRVPRLEVLLGRQILASCEQIGSALDPGHLVMTAVQAVSLKKMVIPRTVYMSLDGEGIQLLSRKYGLVRVPCEAINPGHLVVVRQSLISGRRPFIPIEPLVGLG